MAKVLTISLSDEAYEALRSASVAAHQTPEAIIVATIAQRFAPLYGHLSPSVTNVLNHLRAQGLLVSAAANTSTVDVPARGTSERLLMEDEVEKAVSDAFDQTNLDILDLIERR